MLARTANQSRQYRGDNMQNQRSNYQGGSKQYVSDKIKQFLISRGTARDRAVELCIAGKITLKEIPDYTDRLTVIHFAGLAVDPAVDAVMLKIAARVVKRHKEAKASKSPMDKLAEDNPVEDDGDVPPTDQDGEFDVARERELYEQEQAEENARETAASEQASADSDKRDAQENNPKGHCFNKDGDQR